MSSIIVTAGEAILVVTVLEALWLVQNGNWLENYIDNVSVQATVLGSGMRRLPATLAAYKRHFNAVA